MCFWRDALATARSRDGRGGPGRQENREELFTHQDFTEYPLLVIIGSSLKL